MGKAEAREKAKALFCKEFSIDMEVLEGLLSKTSLVNARVCESGRVDIASSSPGRSALRYLPSVPGSWTATRVFRRVSLFCLMWLPSLRTITPSSRHSGFS